MLRHTVTHKFLDILLGQKILIKSSQTASYVTQSLNHVQHIEYVFRLSQSEGKQFMITQVGMCLCSKPLQYC